MEDRFMEKDINLLLNDKNASKLINELIPGKIATYIESEKNYSIVEILNDDNLSKVLVLIDTFDLDKVISLLSDRRLSVILSLIEIDDLLELMQRNERITAIVESLDNQFQDKLSILKKYESDEIGSVMNPSFIKIDANSDIKQAMKILTSNADKVEVIDPLLVFKGNVFCGLVYLKDLLIARSPCLVDTITKEFPYIYNAKNSISETVEIIKNYDLPLVVVEDMGDVIGIFTVDDALDEAIDDDNKDYSNLAAIDAVGDNPNIIKKSLKRLPWLISLLLISILVSNITGLFEELIASVTVLVFFQTMVLDMAGNIGTQSLANTILHIDELQTLSQTTKYILKELLIAFINAFFLAIIAFVATYLFNLILKTDGKIYISLIVSISLICSLTFTGFFGAVIPIILAKMKIDPSLASGPLITTLNDIFAIVIYFSVALLFFSKIS